jgi:hypothetical protein
MDGHCASSGENIHVVGEIDDDETGRLAAIPDPLIKLSFEMDGHCASSGENIHVVGEIDDDETGRLAAIPDPANLCRKKPPDFVNANTMVARFIAQVYSNKMISYEFSLCNCIS